MDISGLSSYYSDVYANVSSSSTAAALQSNISSVTSATTDDELMDACKQFESYFIEQMFKEMWKTVPESEYSFSSTSSMVDYYKDEMIKSFAEQTTDQSSLGLAQTLYEQMKRNYNL